MGALLLASQQFLKWLKERLQSSCNLPNILGGKLSLGFIGHAQSSSRRSRSRDIDRTSFRRNAFKRDSGFFTLISTGRGVWIRMEVPSHSHAMRAIRSAVDSSPNSHSSTRPISTIRAAFPKDFAVLSELAVDSLHPRSLGF